MSTISSVVSTLLGRPDALADQTRSHHAGRRDAANTPQATRVRIPDTGDIRQRATKLAQLGARLLPAEQSAYAAEIARDGLSSISDLITELRRLVDDAEHFQTKTGREDLSLYQRQIDSVSRTIQTIADQTTFAGTKLLGAGGLGDIGGSLGAARGGGIQPSDVGGEITAGRVMYVDARVESYGVRSVPLDSPFGTTDIDVVVTQSAQIAGFFLSFGGNNLDLGVATDQFVIEIDGVEGTQELSFASGTTLPSVVAAINSFSNETGVVAVASGTGFRLHSNDHGSDEFVSVKIVDDGGMTGTGIGLYSLIHDDWRRADASSRLEFNTLDTPTIDYGQDIGGTINGIEAVGSGKTLSLDEGGYDLRITLTRHGAERNHPHDDFTAFTVVPLSRNPLAGRALGAIINGEGLDNAAKDRDPARDLISAAQEEASRSVRSLESFGSELRATLAEAIKNAEGIAGLDMDPESARATAALAVRSVLTDDPRGLVSALANFSPQRTLSLLSRES